MELKPPTPMGEDREYNLKCKVQIVRQNYKEITDGKRHETTSVLLLPEMDTTEASRFFTTYLPDVSTICVDCGNEDLRIYSEKCNKCESTKLHTEHTEVPGWIAAPIHSPSRLAVLRKNNYCTQHHMFVMSTGVEEELRNMVGKTILVNVLPTSEDAICDNAKSVDRTVHSALR